jgi:hypothetical protein
VALSEPTHPLQRAQVTELLPVFAGVAEMESVPPWFSVWGAAGDKAIEPAELATEICTLPVALELAADVAVIVTPVAEVTLLGAV